VNIGVYIYPKAEVLDFSGPFEVFTTASRVCEDNNPFDVFLISEHGGEVVARAGYRVMSDYAFDKHPKLDVAIIVGGEHDEEMHKSQVIQWIQRQAQQVTTVASVCTGVFLLAQAGVIKSHKVTTHWEDIPALKDQFPGLTVVKDVRWVDEGDIVTSGGISAGIDMSLHLVSKLHSFELAEKTARQMEFAWSRNI
jgi:transcriptional regulator GlxA family with amidase domain